MSTNTALGREREVVDLLRQALAEQKRTNDLLTKLVDHFTVREPRVPDPRMTMTRDEYLKRDPLGRLPISGERRHPG